MCVYVLCMCVTERVCELSMSVCQCLCLCVTVTVSEGVCVHVCQYL